MKRIKPFLSKIKFLLGGTPHIEKTDNYRFYIPKPYKCVVIICADFELAWAWRYSKKSENSPDFGLQKARDARINIPKILDLCEKFNIPITWATVGHLFLSKCDKHETQIHPQIERLNYFENKYWNYSEGDWFDDDPCSDIVQAPEWYASDLIDDIINSKVEHEIGCHTFSHIDCSDSICPPHVFENEIEACIELANKSGINLRSFVHPAHTIGNLDSLIKLGFSSYRTKKDKVLGYPYLYKDKLYGFSRTAELERRNGWSIKYHIKRIKKTINRAIRSNTICYLWFHPSLNPEFTTQVLPGIFKYIDEKREDIYITTINEYVEWLIKNNGK